MEKLRIAVIGDIMIDIDLHCECKRICQEGPWPVLKILREDRRLGGAGNVATMCAALDCETLLLGFEEGASEKRRFFVDGKLTGPRLDADLLETANEDDVYQWMKKIHDFEPEAIIVADHGKGVISKYLMECLSKTEIPVFIDPVLMTPPIPGGAEAVAGSRTEIGMTDFGAKIVIVKAGPDGVTWYGDDEGALPSFAKQVVDPLGAGDQFIAELVVKRCLKYSWAESIEWANVAAGLQCERQGCVPVTASEICDRIAERLIEA